LLVVGSTLERRRALALVMEAAGVFDVVEATSALETIGLVGQRGFEGFVCVWPLEEAQGGLELLRFLRKNDKNAVIAVVAHRAEQWGMREVLRAGANYYFTKPSDLDAVAAHMEIGIRGRSVAETRFSAGDLRVDVNRHQVWRGEKEIFLTRIQFRLLVVLLEHAGEVISKGDLFEKCWRRHDDPRGDGEHLVEVHVSELRRKLHAAGKPVLHTIYGLGYALRASDPDSGNGQSVVDAGKRALHDKTPPYATPNGAERPDQPG
jgi:DNA-binding response OmpR family regulator